MRETHSFDTMIRSGGYAAYSLFSYGAPALVSPGNPASLEDYLPTLVNRRAPPFIGASIGQHFGNFEQFCAHFECPDPKPAPSFERDREKLIKSGRTKDWFLAVVEVKPSELRLHYLSNALWRKHQRAIQDYRSTNPDHPTKTNAEITADLPDYHEMLIFRAPNPVLAVQRTIFEFDVPRDDGTGSDHYAVHFMAYDILIVEPFGLAQRQICISQDAIGGEHLARVTEIQ